MRESNTFTTYQGDKIEAKRDGKVIAELAGVTWSKTRVPAPIVEGEVYPHPIPPHAGSLIFDRLFDYSKEPFDVVVNDSITLPNLVIMNSGRLHTDVTYEFEQLT